MKKSKEYATTSLSINQDTDLTQVAVTDTDRLETLSKLRQKLVKEKKEPDLDLRIKNTETVIPFQKKAPNELPQLKFTYYNTTTKKDERVEFYDYMQHLDNFDFTWKNSAIKFKYSVELSTDKKNW